MRQVFWIGSVSSKSDFGSPITDEFIDGKTKRGPWAVMTPADHAKHGCGLGTGCGQRYKKQADGKWLKVEG